MTNLATNNIMETREAENRVMELFKTINKINNKNIMESDTMISNKIKEMTTKNLKLLKIRLKRLSFKQVKK